MEPSGRQGTLTDSRARSDPKKRPGGHVKLTAPPKGTISDSLKWATRK